MQQTNDLLQDLNHSSREQFRQQQAIMSFSGFLERLRSDPERLMRNAAEYLHDVFEHYGHQGIVHGSQRLTRWRLFDQGTERGVPIIGSENVQDEIMQSLRAFVRQGFANKLILLHGPNGSAKSSIIESIAHAMHCYSELEEGSIYRFSWIFPTDKSATPQGHGEGPIGFGGSRSREITRPSEDSTYAFLDERKIASKIHSEFKENPLFLIPMPQREIWLREWVAAKKNIRPEDVELPPHVLLSGLSKRNQLIMQQLLAAYDGDMSMVLRHVQVERFYYSRQYRVGIGTVEPQMSIDALERQLTMDRNIANLPTVLHNISFHEAMGPLVEANRGILEFSDFLKRPVEAFKYLLSTVEKGTLNLPSSTANLDTVFFATTNEKHLDAFKMLPDFASFRSRIELVTAPYLLRSSQEERIYDQDVKVFAKTKKIAPHSVSLLCLWAVMTRLKHPDPEYYETKHRSLIARLDPLSKARLYDLDTLSPKFKANEEHILREQRARIMSESENVLIYEGRFGASPREVRGILYRAFQSTEHETLTPMAIFEQLEKLVKDRSVYEFLQLEPRGEYHQPGEFIKVIRNEFIKLFEREVTASMTLVEESEYENLLNRYVDHVVAHVKKERLHNKATSSYEQPSEKIMQEVEKIIGVSSNAEKHREGLLGRIAAYRIDHPNEKIQVPVIFQDYLQALEDHYYKERQKLVESNFMSMLQVGTEDEKNLSEKEIALAKTTYAQLEKRFGYDSHSARESLKFLFSVRGK